MIAQRKKDIMMSEKNITSMIRELEERRRKAMLLADTKTLEALFDEALIYIHSTGTRDTRATYLAKLESGAMRYETITLEVTEITIRERFAILAGRMTATVRTANGKIAIASRYEAIWHQSADSWRVMAIQGFTPAPDHQKS